MLYRTYLNPPFNAIFVESYEDLPKEDNYLMKTLLLYLEFFHYFGLSIPTFVELYPLAPSESQRRRSQIPNIVQKMHYGLSHHLL
jgi:hypothetical protein